MSSVGDRVAGRWQQIGQGLASARAGFHEQVLALIEGLAHSPHHLHLLRTVLVAGEALGYQTAFFEHLREPGEVKGLWLKGGFKGSPLQARGEDGARHVLC